MKNEVVAHLEMLQNVITRMSTNSFLIKNWAVVLITLGVSAAFSLNQTTNSKYLVMIGLLLLPFWLLDGYFLSLEKRYRDLYDKVRKENKTNFSMDLPDKIEKCSTFWVSFFSKTLVIFYAGLAVAALIVFYLGGFRG